MASTDKPDRVEPLEDPRAGISSPLTDAIDRYRDRFGALPHLAGWPYAEEDELARRLVAAVEKGAPVSDEQLWAGLAHRKLV